MACASACHRACVVWARTAPMYQGHKLRTLGAWTAWRKLLYVQMICAYGLAHAIPLVNPYRTLMPLVDKLGLGSASARPRLPGRGHGTRPVAVHAARGPHTGGVSGARLARDRLPAGARRHQTQPEPTSRDTPAQQWASTRNYALFNRKGLGETEV